MTDTRNTYEGLFLFPQSAASNLKEAADHLESRLSRANAEVLSFAKWDERRLAYEIEGNKRGVYFLVYFKAEPSSIAGLERDCNLSEDIIRFLVTRADTIPAEIIESADGRQKLADEIRLRGEKDEKRPGREGRSRVVDAATRAEEERHAAEAKGSEGDGETDAEGGSEAKAEASEPAEAAATTD